MVSDFLTWLNEAARRSQMAFAEPDAETPLVGKPEKGDLIVTSPSLFFKKGKLGASLRSMLPSLYRITTDQTGGQYQAAPLFPSQKTKNQSQKVFSAPDIMNDVSFRYPEHERSLGQPGVKPASIWLYIPPEAEEYKRLFLHRFSKYQNKERAEKLDRRDRSDKEDLQQIAVARQFGGDNFGKWNAHLIRQKKIAQNLQAQQQGFLPRQIDPDDDPEYVAQVTPPSQELPNADDQWNSLIQRMQSQQKPEPSGVTSPEWDRLFR